MSKLLEITNQIIAQLPEVAAPIAVNYPEDPSLDEQLTAYYRAQLIRANEILDKRKNDVFANVLNLETRGQIERAMIAYDTDYLLQLGLSIEATAELAESLIRLAKRYPVSIPEDWINVSKMQIDVEPKDDSETRRSIKL